MKPYLVCAYADVTKKEADDGQEPELILGLTLVMARGEDDAKIKAAQKIKEDHPRLVVLARPF